MTRATYTVLFYIKRTKELKDGKVPIYARITVNGQRAEFGLQMSIQPVEWDSVRGCAEGFTKNAKSINSDLQNVKANLLLKKRELDEKGRQIAHC